MADSNLKHYIGIDIGGTNIKGGIVDENGGIVLDLSVKTEVEKGSETVIKNVENLIEMLISKSNITDFYGIGIGIPGMIDSTNGIVIYANNLYWKDVHIAEPIQKLFNIPVKITNDANAAALGEARFGAEKNCTDSVLLTLGTGVGSGIIINKKIFEGNLGVGAEIGHMVIRKNGEKCTCGRKGCFETYASATALIRETKKAMTKHPESKLWEIGSAENVSAKTAFVYKDKDKIAKKIVKDYIKSLACGIANVANIFRPQVILIGGGVCAEGDNLLKPLQKELNKQIYGGKLCESVPIRIASLGNKAGLLGAAALVM